MTTIYIPRLIETAEQAEALPERTPVIIGPFVAFRAFEDQGWMVTLADEEYGTEELLAAYSHYAPTALVPIEAEEEWSERAIAEGEFIGTIRLVTPWEEA